MITIKAIAVMKTNKNSSKTMVIARTPTKTNREMGWGVGGETKREGGGRDGDRQTDSSRQRERYGELLPPVPTCLLFIRCQPVF